MVSGYLTGTTQPPPQTTNNNIPNPAYDLWERQDQLLVSWLLASINESVLTTSVGLNTSNEVWTALAQAFADESREKKILQYKLQVQTMKKRAMSMREYLTKIKSCKDFLASAGYKLKEDDQVLHILAGLGSEYDPVVGPITARSEPFTANDVG